jgi:hypothetical protein
MLELIAMAKKKAGMGSSSDRCYKDFASRFSGAGGNE